MKSSAKVAVKSRSREVKRKTREEMGKSMSDPTLEGKDENKVGRIQRKTSQADNDEVKGPAARDCRRARRQYLTPAD